MSQLIRYSPSPAKCADTEDPEDNSVLCRDVRKLYPDGTEALAGVSLYCPPGKITVLLGPSGCGKTTLLRSIAGLSPITSGQISVGSRDVSRMDPERRGVAMVFQGSGLYPDKTAFRNIEFPLRMSSVPRKERRRRVEDVARQLDITDLLDRKPHELSGGQRQRVGIGRAIVRKPKVVLMDEPLSALDAELRARMRTEILSLQREIGMTVVYVTHDQVEALSLADQLVVLRAGRIEQSGDPEAVFRKPVSLYAAQFLGAMNTLPVTVIPAMLLHTRCLDDRTLPADGSSIGFRAEDVRLGVGADPGDLNMSGPIDITELLGRERLIHFRFNGCTVRGRISADAEISSEIHAYVPRSNLHFFDQAGRRVEPPTSAR